MNREEELTDILRKVEWGQMDSTVAFDRILRLFNVVNRREQLIAFAEFLASNPMNNYCDKVDLVNEFLQGN